MSNQRRTIAEYHNGDYFCTQIGQLKTLPIKIGGDLIFKMEKAKCVRHIDSFTTLEVGGYVDMRQLNLRNLSGIGKHCFKSINTTLYIRQCISSHVLGIMLIKNLQNVEVRNVGSWSNEWTNRDLNEAVKIINVHLESPERCIMSCKQDLMNAGLKEYAKL